MADLRPLLALLLAGAIALAGCSGSDPPAETTTKPAPTTTTTAPPATTTTQTPPPATTVIVTQTASPVTITETASPSPSSSSAAPTSSQAPTGPTGERPILEGVVAAVTGPNSVELRWHVEDDHDGVRTVARYGVGEVLSGSTQPRFGNGTFAVAVTGLGSCTTYTYQVTATDVGGQSVSSLPATFTTQNGVSLAISDVNTSAVLQDRFTVHWTVQGAADTVSTVEYGTTTSYGQSASGPVGGGAKSLTLSGLSQNTPYNFRITLRTPCQNAATPNQVQTTARLVDVEIRGNSGILSFTPNPLSVPADAPLVFRVKNSDTAAHTWNLLGLNHGSGNIAPGATVTLPASITLDAGQHTMNCSYHTSMTGTVNAS